MPYNLISGDNHIDLTYLPPDLWSSQAPGKWKLMVPRVEELGDGCHWFVDAQDKGMWNGVGPGFLPYTRGMFGHIDEMHDIGFEWDSRPGARPRPTRPGPRLAALDRAGHAGDGEAVLHPVAAGALGALPARHDGSAGLAPGFGRLREVPGLQLRPGRVGRDLAAVRVRPARHRVLRPGPVAELQAEAERLFPPPGLRHLSTRSIPGADHPSHRRGQHHLGRGLPAPGLHLAELAQHTREEPGWDLGAGTEEDHVRERGSSLQHQVKDR